MPTSFGDIAPSRRSLRCEEKMLNVEAGLEKASAACTSGKSFISLAIEDPTVDGNFLPPPLLASRLVECAKSGRCNGYGACSGATNTCISIGRYWKKHFAPSMKEGISPDNVVVGSGSSDVLCMCFAAICCEGDNILLPSPFSAHYSAICAYHDIQTKFYRCDPEKDWRIDFDHLRSLVDDRTKAILMTNPSNPCGSNFSREHIADLIRLCEEFHLPLIADEIYAGLVFSGETFTSVASFDTPVPRLVVSGLSERFNVPGWRLDWVILMDRDDYGNKLLDGLECMAARCLMPNSLVQAAVAKALEETPQSYFDDCVKRVEEGAMLLYDGLKECVGLRPMRPRGSAFMCVFLVVEELDGETQTDVDFARKLAEEENVHVLLGESFNMQGVLRITVTRSLPITREAVSRIQSFCERHRRPS